MGLYRLLNRNNEVLFQDIFCNPWKTVVNLSLVRSRPIPKQRPRQTAPRCISSSYHINKGKFLILQIQPLPEQRNPHHGVSITQVHEDLKEETQASRRHKKTPQQATDNRKHSFWVRMTCILIRDAKTYLPCLENPLLPFVLNQRWTTFRFIL